MVQGSDWEDNVLMVLKGVRFGQARSIEAGIKVMGVISDVFKSCYADFPARKLTELNAIPWWVFSGADNAFGYLEHDTNDVSGWKDEFIDNFIDWLMVEKPESYGAFSVEYDMTLAMETFLGDFRDCYSANQPTFHFRDTTPLDSIPKDNSIEDEYLFQLNKDFLRKKHVQENSCIIEK